MYGCIILILELLPILIPPYSNFIIVLIVLLFICIPIFFGFKGNELTVKHYLNRGYLFVDPESDNVKTAKSKWKIP